MTNERERLCADSFDRFLENQLKINNRKWEPVPEGQDPPDFFLLINHTRFAVEVTSTEVMRKVSIGAGEVQEETYEHSHTELIKEVEKAADEAGFLKGAYAIAFSQPITISRFRQVRKDVLNQLLQYIQQTQSMTSSLSETIEIDDQSICNITKLHDQSNVIYEVFTDFAWPESPEVTGKVCDLLQAVVTEKRLKILAKGQVDPQIISLPKILLLLNTYRSADRSMYFDCIGHIESLDFFHSVFIVMSEGKGFLLHTSDEGWLETLDK